MARLLGFGGVVLGALVSLACLNEVQSAEARIKSKQEIMNSTTIGSAVKLVLGLDGARSKPELASLLESLDQRSQQKISGLRAVKRHGDGDDPEGYAAVEGAMQMLAEMMEEADNKLDMEVSECGMFDEHQMYLLTSTRNEISSFNADANTALGKMLDASGQISTISKNLAKDKDDLADHNRQCEEDIAATRNLLSIVTADVGVMEVILNLTQCGGDAASAAVAASMLQAGAGAGLSTRAVTSGQLMVNCGHCSGGRGMVMLQNDKLQPLLNKLQSMYAHKFLQNQLKITFRKAEMRGHAVALSQLGVAHQLKLVRGSSPVVLAEVGHRNRMGHRRTRNETENLTEPAYSVSVSDVPAEPQPMDCIPTTKCTLGEGNCVELEERFANIHGGLEDKRDELSNELAELEKHCEDTREILETQISDNEEKLGQEQSNLATSTGQKSEAEAGSKNKAIQYTELHTDYTKRMTECCDNQNDLKSEKCALEKIRGELLKLEGVNIFVVDCEVSGWSAQECTATCGGGERLSTREVLVPDAEGGVQCPALEKTEPCNTFECPVDCVLNDWEGWGSCSVDCGGGVRVRTRSVVQEPEHGGIECDSLKETESCNAESCDADCELKDWSEWTGCSKGCGSGTQKRTRDISEPARGTGTCAAADSPARMGFKTCNTFSCDSLLPEGRSTIRCVSKVDIVVVLDGSGSLGSWGWSQTQEFAERFIANLKGGDDGVHVALEVFSYSVKWIQHFTNDTAGTAAEVDSIRWMMSTTSTDTALLEAEGELIRGREDADTVVIIVTDGWPNSQRRTRLASESLKEKARVLWVPVGSGAPVELVEELASLPKKEHVVQIDWFSWLDDADTINEIIADTCPMIE